MDWKKIGLIVGVVVVLLVIFAVFFIMNFYPRTIITINPEDKKCTVDEDCVTTMVKCSCDCGVPINKIHWSKYLDKKAKRCTFYFGPMCFMKCEQELKCINGICTITNE